MSMKRSKSRFVSLFLVFMMVLSLFPTAVFAASPKTEFENGGTLTAEFENSLQAGKGDQTATLVFDAGDIAAAGVTMESFDYSSLSGYLSGTPTSLAVNVAMGSSGVYYAATNKLVFYSGLYGDTGEFVKMSFPVSGDIPAGYYDVSFVVTEYHDNDEVSYVTDAGVAMTATLTVLTEDGELPEVTEPEGDPYAISIDTAGTWAEYITASAKVDGSVVTKADEGDTVVLDFSADADHSNFSVANLTVTYGDNQTVAVSDENGVYSFTMPAGDVAVSVTFEEGQAPETPSYDITVDGTEGGTITVAPDDGKDIEPGEEVTITVKPDQGNGNEPVVTVTGPEGNDDFDATVETSEPAEDGTVTVTFPMPEGDVDVSVDFGTLYNIKKDVAGDGALTISPAEKVSAGTEVTVLLAPNAGNENETQYTVKTASGSNVTTTAIENGFKFTMPVEDVTVSADFGKITPDETLYDVTLGKTGDGEVTSDKDKASAGDTVTITVTPAEGNENKPVITAEDINGTPVDLTPVPEKPGDYTFTMPEGGVKVDVAFGDIATDGFTLTAEQFNGGVVQFVNGTGIAQNKLTGLKGGETIKLVIRPNQGYELVSIEAEQTSGDNLGDIVKLTDNGDGTYSMTMPEANVSIDAYFQLKDVPAPSYDVSVNYDKTMGVAALGGLTAAHADDTVTVYVKPNTGFAVQEVAPYIQGTATKLQVNQNGSSSVPGYEGWMEYTFTMPQNNVSVSVTFVKNDGGMTGEGDPDVAKNWLEIHGTVIDSNDGKPLEGAEIVVTNSSGNGKVSLGAGSQPITDADGNYSVLVPKDGTYNVQAVYATGINEGTHVVGDGYVVKGHVYGGISASAVETGEYGASTELNMTLTLGYKWDITNDGSSVDNIINGVGPTAGTVEGESGLDEAGVEFIYAGPDGKLLTADDYYEVMVPTGDTAVKVQVIAGKDGEQNMYQTTDSSKNEYPTVHYKWQVVKDSTELSDIFVGEGNKPGWSIPDEQTAQPGNANCNDYYLFDVDYNPATKDVMVYISADAQPATSDDYYETDINGDGNIETVKAGVDGFIGTEDDVYEMLIDGEMTPVYAGEDKIAGTADDWYLLDADGHEDGNKEQCFVGEDRLPDTADDFYRQDLDKDSVVEDDEKIFAGDDKDFNTSDDYYLADIPHDGEDAVIVKVHPTDRGEGAEDRYEFGESGDWFDWTVGGKPVIVYVGEDTVAGTDDDWYKYDVPKPGQAQDENGNLIGAPETVEVTVTVGEDGIPGTSDDTYELDADMDGENETVHVGPDGIPGSNDDFYDDDVNGDGKPERVYVGDDGIFGTPDDHYDAIVNTPDGNQEKKPVYAGDDGKFSEPDDPDNDDWYPWDTNEDGKTDPSIYDGEDNHDKVFIDGDSLAGTDDDYYFEDVDDDGEKEQVFVGPDGIPGTEDDYYEEDVNGDGKPEDITSGEDSEFGTDDDFYPIPDQDGDGDEEKVFPGDDGELGTPDDWYEADVDKDGEDEKVYVGDDKIPGTDDDWYYAKITFNAAPGTVNGSSTWSVLTSGLTALPTASRSGSYSFVGWSLSSNSGSILTLDQVKALKTDTVLYAYYRYTGPTGGGGGGGGVGSSTYIVTFNSKGGSSVASQRVDRNDTVDEPRDPSRDGYDFTGWYTDSSCTKLYDFDTKVTKSFTLYAGWEKTDAVKPGTGVNEEVHEAVSSVLQMYPHIAYIAGYQNGTVGPNTNMTRAQIAQVFYRLLNADTRAKYYTTTNKFTDCDPTAWYNEAVSTLANLGIVGGYGDGTFGPNDTITRAQFAAICARIGNLKMTGANSFTDVKPGSWYYSYVQAAADNNWVTGYGDGTFGPNNRITRAQVVTILNRVLERTPLSNETFEGFAFNNWTDNQNPDAWFYRDMIEAGTGHTCDHDETTGVEIWTGVID